MNPAPAPYTLTRPGGAPIPVVFASPHSGERRPADMKPARGLDERLLQRSEDRFVDALIAPASGRGVTLIAGDVSRTYLDLNRAADEVDADMVAGGAAGLARRRTAKVAAGLGVTPRVCGEGVLIYDRLLAEAEVARRLAEVHRPYHAALAGLLDGAAAAHGGALLVDWHSMPAAAVEPGVDMVLGDRFGAACGREVSAWIASVLKEAGFEVRLNAPYAGGYTLDAHGDPAAGRHAVQIEINRALYLDEDTLEQSEECAALRSRLADVFDAFAAAPWPALLHRA